MSSNRCLVLVLLAVTSLLGCATTTPARRAAVQDSPGRIVTATYRVAADRQAEFLDLLHGCEATMRQEGLVTERPFVRMRSIQDPEILLEVFEWVDPEAFDRAQENPRVLEWWGQYESVWKDGGFGVNEVPEAAMPWAQYQALD